MASCHVSVLLQTRVQNEEAQEEQWLFGHSLSGLADNVRKYLRRSIFIP